MKNYQYNNCFRVSPTNISENSLTVLQELLLKYPKCVSEITFFTNETHAPITLEKIAQNLDNISKVLPFCKKHGYKVGVNCLTTLGHHAENLKYSLQIKSPLMDIEGNVCKGTFCPTSDEMFAYNEKVYKMIAKLDISYIWIDDDVRIRGHMPVDCACFCDGCLRKFEIFSGMKNLTREKLFAMFNDVNCESADQVRLMWINFNKLNVKNILSFVQKTVHAENKKIELGFMTGERFFEGFDFDTWAKAIKGKNKVARWRPGGGVYDEFTPIAALGKANQMGRQCALLPQFVSNIQSEIENFPYHPLMKSVKFTEFESLLYLFAGCNGTAYNVFSASCNVREQEGYFELASNMNHVGKKIASNFGTNPPKGVCVYWNKSLAVNSGTYPYLNKVTPDLSFIETFFEIGIPACYDINEAQAFIINERIVRNMTHEEIMKVLKKGIFIDGFCLQYLINKGYSKYLGFKIKEVIHDDMAELTIGGSGDQIRNPRQSFWWNEDAFSIEKNDEKAEYLTKLVDFENNFVGYAMGMFENELGGRVCVSGYFPFTFCYDANRTNLIKQSFLYLTNNKLGAYVKSVSRVALWERPTKNGKRGYMLSNHSLDDAKITLAIKNNGEDLAVFYHNKGKLKKEIITALGNENGYFTYELQSIKPLSVALILPIE